MEAFDALWAIRPAWMQRAACRGLSHDLFFTPDGAQGVDEKDLPGLLVCQSCPVQPDCLDYALKANEKFGLWGGMPTKKRKRLRRKRLKTV